VTASTKNIPGPLSVELPFSPFLHSSSDLLSRRERRDELATRPIFMARDTGTSRVSHCSKRTTQFHNNATPASERTTLCKRDAGRIEKMEMGEAGRFTATCRLQQGEHKGFRNLEGHRFMSAVTTVIYTYALNVSERACPCNILFTSNDTWLCRPFAICPLEFIRLRNF